MWYQGFCVWHVPIICVVVCPRFLRAMCVHVFRVWCVSMVLWNVSIVCGMRSWFMFVVCMYPWSVCVVYVFCCVWYVHGFYLWNVSMVCGIRSWFMFVCVHGLCSVCLILCVWYVSIVLSMSVCLCAPSSTLR